MKNNSNPFRVIDSIFRHFSRLLHAMLKVLRLRGNCRATLDAEGRAKTEDWTEELVVKLERSQRFRMIFFPVLLLLTIVLLSFLEGSDWRVYQHGVASWYGPGFYHRKTANGETFLPGNYVFTAAHRSLPMGSYVLVKNRRNGRRVVVRINDRGPYVDGRVIDLSRAAAEKLDMIEGGTAPVTLYVRRYHLLDAPP